MDAEDSLLCVKHSGHATAIKNIQTRQVQRDKTLGKIWDTIATLERNKLSLRLFVPLSIAMLAFVGTLFGLVYHSQQRLLDDINLIKTATQVIEARIK